MKRIVVLPLDERPCNYSFNQFLVKGTPYEVITPSLDILGNKKTPGKVEEINQWLLKEAKNADGFVLALDTLIYGGIVPSRLHHDSTEVLLERLNNLRKVKKINPSAKIYAYNLIMRNPKYSSADEEPDYYEFCGREIYLYGTYMHKRELGIITEEETKKLEEISNTIDKVSLNDYLDRRMKNIEVNKAFLKLVQEGIIEFGIVPQDDSSPYGLTATDQRIIRKEIKDLNIELDCYMYPGADEVTNVLLARLINKNENVRPKFYLKYSSVTGETQIPLYEDRLLGETIKYQILATGGIIVSSIEEADLMCLVNTPSSNMKESNANYQNHLEYDAFRTLIEYVELAAYGIELGKKVIIADVAYANGGDVNLLKLLKQKGILMKISAYAGWNTSSNTLGTCIPQGIFDFIYPNRKENLDFLGLRFVEDIGYCSVVRSKVSQELVEPYNHFLIDGVRGPIVDTIKAELNKFIETHLNIETHTFTITDIYSPWNRMFETGLEVIVNENK